MVNDLRSLSMKSTDLFLQDGGSLDLIMKKVMRVPENILGRITVAVNNRIMYARKVYALLFRFFVVFFIYEND